MTLKRFVELRFLVPQDFPPFVYRTEKGRLTGYAIGVANALCAEARMRCRIVEVPWEKLADALRARKGDIILVGPRLLPGNFEIMDFTRPYLRALGAFAVLRNGRVRGASGRDLAGKRIAVVKGTVHAAWLRRNFGRSRIHQYPDFIRAAEALGREQVDALFGDWLQIGYWTRGTASGGCCMMLESWFPAREFTWNDVAMAVRPGDLALRRVLDRYLDILDSEGRLASMAMRFLPVGKPTEGKAR